MGFNLSFKISRQDSHQGLGCKSVLGSLLVISLGHVREHGVCSLVDVVDDLAQVGLEVSGGQTLQVGESSSGNVSLPLESTLALLHHLPQVGLLLHELDEALGDLQLVPGDGGLASRESVLVLLLIRETVPGQLSSLPHVGGESNEHEVLGNVVHDLGLEEDLGSVIHDLIGQLGLSNVLSQLLDANASSLSRTILVNDLVTLSLGCFTISSKISHQLLDNLKLSSEESIFVRIHLVPVHLEESEVHARDSLHQAFIRS